MSKKGAGPDVEKFKRLFKDADKNGDGFVDIHELKKFMTCGGRTMSDSQIADIFVFIDGPMGDKRITYKEFEDGLERILSFVKKLRELFNEKDTSGDGFLDRNELRALLNESGRKFEPKEVDAILKQADTNGDNKISFEEFLEAVS